MNKEFGKAIGSSSYIKESKYFFIRTRALQTHSFLPILGDPECVIPMLPNVFKNNNLEYGDILLSKDSNIGEVVFLNKDLKNHMMCAGLVKLMLPKNIKYYVLAFLKSPFFKEQIMLSASRGSTIRHAKSLWLNALIPFPNYDNSEELIKHITLLTKAIIRKEESIQYKYQKITKLINEEILNNQKNKFSFNLPTYKEISIENRIDAGVYTNIYKKNIFYIKNYKNGFYGIEEKNIYSGSTPANRVQNTGKFTWVTPTDISAHGILKNAPKIHCPKNNINSDCTLIVNRTSKGGAGEYVGLSAFYNYNHYGPGHHNQGIYRVLGYPKGKLIFIATFMNSPIARKICAGLSVGSKMKEIKLKQFIGIPFPKFPKEIQNHIVKNYYTEERLYKEDLSLNNFETEDLITTNESGIWQLNYQIIKIKQELDKILNKIIMNRRINISFDFYK